MPPSTRLKMMRPPRAGSIFFSSVAASSGRYLYMKMKKAREIRRLPIASQLLTVAAFSVEVADVVGILLRATGKIPCRLRERFRLASPIRQAQGRLRRDGRGARRSMVISIPRGFILHHVFDGDVGGES